jgi:SAM-dependent methyltransferase
MTKVKNDARTLDQVRQHYEVEKALASKLRNASRVDRRQLYSSLYDEMYRSVPLHPQLTRKVCENETKKRVAVQMDFIKSYLNKDITFLEVGPGDCALSFEVAKHVKQVYGVDVSAEVTKSRQTPANFQLILSDGTTVPVAPNSVDVVYSNQLMEHLHPEDAVAQLENIYRALVPGGVYICITPNRLNGPHDVSQHFDPVATGFHLQEYAAHDLNSLFIKAGFSKAKFFIRAKGKYFSTLSFPIFSLERVLDFLPHTMRRYLASNLPTRPFMEIRLVGIK